MWNKIRDYSWFEISNWAGDILIAIIEAFVAIFLTSYDPLRVTKLYLNNEYASNLLAFLVYFFLLLVLTYIILLLKNCIYFSTRGYVKATDPFLKVNEVSLFENSISKSRIYDNGKEEKVDTIKVDFIYIHFINDPKSIIIDSVAKDLTAYVTYRDITGRELFPSFFGVWADKPALSRLKSGEQPRDLLFTNISPGRLGQKLNIGFQEIGKPYYYAYSQESANCDFYKNPDLKIENEEVSVEIEIKGSRIQRTVKCKIVRNGNQITIKQVDKQKWENNNC